ncbi:hypothetical protein [Paludibaculum fermentans]|uniref:Uncharacterized protein n=1 Tax=Paludibaculum fermentans TaxID=1473598 RepID=A0A7S7NML7_PALFE|nr:hypothetical protein [Paludibaculum fermentans]QOY86417.1 hypothetical protein IRI77_26960 [Paludibaculum fermentans]
MLSEAIVTDSHVSTLDPVGNRLNRASSVPSLPRVGITYDNNDRPTSGTCGTNGNSLASGNSYTYECEDQLTRFNGEVLIMTYDGGANRMARPEGRVTTRHSHPGLCWAASTLRGA